MGKLTKAEIKAHNRAKDLLSLDRDLTQDEIFQVIDGWHEGASHSNAAHSAFFTPYELAMHLALEAPGRGRILDLCSGIGILSLAIRMHNEQTPGDIEFTLVELNPDYCDVARKLLPHATVICGSIFDEETIRKVGDNFDFVVSNPPFGANNTAIGNGPRYRGKMCEYSVIDIASDLASAGAFILPQNSAPFRLSGPSQKVIAPEYRTPAYCKFTEVTGIELEPNMGIDTSFANKLWRGTTVSTEIALCDFEDLQAKRRLPIQDHSQNYDLFSLMAA